MGEFESNPEGLRAHQLELENNLSELKDRFDAIQTGNWEEKRTGRELENIIALTTYTKRELLKTLIELGDFEEIANRLAAEAFSQKEAYAGEDMPVYIDMVFGETYGTELDDPKLHSDVAKIANNVKNEVGIQSFSDEAEEE